MSNEPTKAAATSTDAGAAFLTSNKSKPGVVTLPDGLQYKVIVEGKGAKPTLNDVVTVHYAGTLVDGKEALAVSARNWFLCSAVEGGSTVRASPMANS